MLQKLKSWTGRRATPTVPADEVTSRALRLVETGPHPERIFLCAQEGGGLLTCKFGDQPGPSMLLFSSPYYAIDYINETGVEADVAHMQLDALPQSAASWLEAGADTFVLNRCPRCDVALIAETQHLKNREVFLKLWAVDRATRAMKGEQLATSAFSLIGDDDLDGALHQLREIRNHLDVGIPQVHHFIALLAEMQGYEDEKASAVHWIGVFKDYDFKPGMNAEEMAKVSAELLAAFQRVGR
jgi:hypothetical protein